MKQTTVIPACLAALSLLANAGRTRAADDVVTVSVELQTPKKDSGRAEKPLDEIAVDLWLPPDVDVVRGMLVNPFYRKAVGQEHWRAACRQWGFGIAAANYFGVRSSDFGSLPAALEKAAEVTGKPELAHAPLLFVGMSAGAGMSTRLADLLPERTLAAAPVCLEVGPRSEKSRHVPIVTIFGERDGRQMEKLLEKLPVERAAGARWAIAVQWRRRHEFARANNLAMPWFDAVIRARYPQDANPRKGPVKLRTIPEESGWLGNPWSWENGPAAIATFAKYEGERERACWFPDEHVAAVWQSFVIPDRRLRLVEPKGMGDGDGFRTWPAGEPVTVSARAAKDLKLETLELYDGARPLGALAGTPPEASVRLKPGFHTLLVVGTTRDGAKWLSRPNTIIVDDE